MAKNRILYITVVFLSLSFVLFYGGELPYAIFYMTVLIMPVSIIYTLIVYFSLSFSINAENPTLVKGERFNFYIIIKNKSPLFFPYINIVYKDTVAFKIEDGADGGTTAPMPARSENPQYNGSRSANTPNERFARARQGERRFAESATFINSTLSVTPFAKVGSYITLVGQYRGSYVVENYDIRIMDLLGLISIPVKKPTGCQVTVYPRIIPIDRFSYKTSFDIDSASRVFSMIDDATTVSDIRGYNIGDVMKRVHWKLSAKTRSLKVKNYEKIAMSSVLLIIDLSGIDGEQIIKLKTEDKMVEAYVALLYYFLNNHFSVSLCFYDDEFVMLKADSVEMFELLCEKITMLEFRSEVAVEDLIDHVSTETLIPSNVCVVTSKLSNGLIERLYSCAEAGNQTSLIYVNEDNDNLHDTMKTIGTANASVTTGKIEISGDEKSNRRRAALAQNSEAPDRSGWVNVFSINYESALNEVLKSQLSETIHE